MFKKIFGGEKDTVPAPIAATLDAAPIAASVASAVPEPVATSVQAIKRHTGVIARIGIRHSRCSDFADTCVLLVRGQPEPLVAEVKDWQLANDITLSSAGDFIAIEIANNERGVPTVFAFENETLTAIKKECGER